MQMQWANIAYAELQLEFLVFPSMTWRMSATYAILLDNLLGILEMTTCTQKVIN